MGPPPFCDDNGELAMTTHSGRAGLRTVNDAR